MTNAIGAGQASVAALAHSAHPKREAGSKADAKIANDGAETTKYLPHEARRHDEAKGSDAATSVKTAEKPSRRPQGDDEKKSDDHDTSFEATIDGIDRPAPQNTAATPAQAADWQAMLALGQMILDRPQKSAGGKSDDNHALTSIGNTPVSAKMLKQDSATALLLAKQRLLDGGTSVDANVGQPSDDEVASSIIVRSRETHWNFSGQETSASLRTTLASQANSAATNPLASFAATGTPKNGDGAPATASDTVKPVLAESSSLDATPDAPDHQSFSDRRETESGPRDRASNSLKGHTDLEVSTSKSADKAAAADTGPTSGISSATQQVRSSVLNALTGDAGGASQTSATLPSQNRPMAVGQVLRTIELTLAPADLGSVTLRLSLKSNVLTVEAEASKASTAKLLSDDRGALEKSLRDAGYDVSSMKITDAGAASATAASAAAPAGGMQFQDNGQARMGFAQRQDGDLQRRDGSTPDQSQQRSRNNNPQSSAAADAANSRQANAIYI